MHAVSHPLRWLCNDILIDCVILTTAGFAIGINRFTTVVVHDLYIKGNSSFLKGDPQVITRQYFRRAHGYSGYNNGRATVWQPGTEALSAGLRLHVPHQRRVSAWSLACAIARCCCSRSFRVTSVYCTVECRDGPVLR